MTSTIPGFHLDNIYLNIYTRVLCVVDETHHTVSGQHSTNRMTHGKFVVGKCFPLHQYLTKKNKDVKLTGFTKRIYYFTFGFISPPHFLILLYDLHFFKKRFHVSLGYFCNLF